MNIQPLNGYVVVKPVEQDEITKSGIYIPETASKETPQEGEVVAVSTTNISSNGTELPIEVKVGDKVIYGRYSGEEIKSDGQDYKVVEMTSLRAIIK